MIDTNITELSVDQLDQLFEGNPEPIPTADSLVVGKEMESSPTDFSEQGTTVEGGGLEEAPDDLFDVKEDEEETTEDSDTDKEKKVKEPKAPKVEDANHEVINEALSKTVEYLIKEGLWVDFEGREELEVTSETWADLSSKQAQHAAYEMFNELVDESGYYGKAIINHIKQGGEAAEIIDLFKEQKSIENMNTSSEEGKQSKIEAYYSDVLNWKPERVRKHVNRLLENDEIDEEFENVEESFKTHYESKLQETQAKQREAEQAKLDSQKKFVDSIKSSLDANTDLTSREKQHIASSMLDFKHKLSNGQKVNDFYLKFAEVQADPNEYVELVQFVTNKKQYLERITKKSETKANKKAFEFIKGNTALAKPKSQNISINDASNKKQGTDFSFFTKK